MQPGTVFLMYHELEMPGRALCGEGPGYVRYAVAEPDFRQHMQRLRSLGLRGVSVSQALSGEAMDRSRVAITFDDGCESDLLAAAPLLKDLGFNATFYIVAGRLGQRGHLSPNQLRALGESGFEIGSHSMTHPYLSDLKPGPLREELFCSKDKLEQVTGRRVDHFSCPGGRWNRAVAEMCRKAGYQSMATSRVGMNSSATDRFELRRVGVQRETPASSVAAWSRGQRLIVPQARQALLDAAKRLVGNSVYERLRSTALHGE